MEFDVPVRPMVARGLISVCNYMYNKYVNVCLVSICKCKFNNYVIF